PAHSFHGRATLIIAVRLCSTSRRTNRSVRLECPRSLLYCSGTSVLNDRMTRSELRKIVTMPPAFLRVDRQGLHEEHCDARIGTPCSSLGPRTASSPSPCRLSCDATPITNCRPHPGPHLTHLSGGSPCSVSITSPAKPCGSGSPPAVSPPPRHAATTRSVDPRSTRR